MLLKSLLLFFVKYLFFICRVKMFLFPMHYKLNIPFLSNMIYQFCFEKEAKIISNDKKTLFIDPDELFFKKHSFLPIYTITKNTEETIFYLSTLYNIVFITNTISPNSILYDMIDPYYLVRYKIRYSNIVHNKFILTGINKTTYKSTPLYVKTNNSLDLINVMVFTEQHNFNIYGDILQQLNTLKNKYSLLYDKYQEEKRINQYKELTKNKKLNWFHYLKKIILF